MAKPVKTALPYPLHLSGEWRIEWDAIDPTTGATVAGVKIKETSLHVAGADGTLPDIPNPILIGVGAG